MLSDCLLLCEGEALEVSSLIPQPSGPNGARRAAMGIPLRALSTVAGWVGRAAQVQSRDGARTLSVRLLAVDHRLAVAIAELPRG